MTFRNFWSLGNGWQEGKASVVLNQVGGKKSSNHFYVIHVKMFWILFFREHLTTLKKPLAYSHPGVAGFVWRLARRIRG